VLDQVPDLPERLRDADDATKQAPLNAFDLRVVYYKASDRLSISATLTEADPRKTCLWSAAGGSGLRLVL
jgi:hypothetical protein